MNRNCCRQSQISQWPSHPPNTFRRNETRRSACSATSYGLPEICQKFGRTSKLQPRYAAFASGLSGRCADAIKFA
jgi:hypothetical protein